LSREAYRYPNEIALLCNTLQSSLVPIEKALCIKKFKDAYSYSNVELASLLGVQKYEPDVDIPITFTGIRPGEKFLETLFAEDEHALPTEHEKIFMVKVNSNLREKDLLDCIGRLITLVERSDNGKIVDLLREMVPDYHPMDRELATTGRET